ncbi:MAG: DUF4838 domain-containing protein [Candidatus Krumholzibacteriota bacterium]
MIDVLRRIFRMYPLILLGVLVTTGCGEGPGRHWIAEGSSDGRIVLAVDDSLTRHAAAELQHYLAAATGAKLPVIPEAGLDSGPGILVGWGEEAAAVAPDLGPDAFVWHGGGDGRLIIGGPGRGTLYGVYAFLEEHLGIRRYTPESTLIPERRVFDLPRLEETRSPAFPVRWLHMPCAEDQAWCDWHGLHSRAHRDGSWGMFVHTFEQLVPPAVYFADHPEYFSEIKGRRLENQQLCLTNEDVFELVVAGLRERMAERPEARYWSVSQNDRHGACECSGCGALVERHGSQAGPLIAFVNRVAAEFPDKIISTLAYSYTRRAPRDIEVAPNVNICLCSIECDRAEPIASGERNADFLSDIQKWSDLTDNLMIWDYVVQFSNYVSPFPNFHVLQPNIRLFRDYGAQLMFQQGSGGSRSDLSELKQYVIAKLLWDPDRDVSVLVDDFMAGYYGEAAGHMRRYFDLMHDRLPASGERLGIYDSPVVESGTWLTPETLSEADGILAAAEEAVVEYPEVKRRVSEARLSLTYARLEQGKLFGAGEHGMFEAAPAGGWRVKAGWPETLEEFVAGCNAAGFERIHERHSPPDEYAENTRRFFAEGMAAHLAAGRSVELTVPFSPKYPANGVGTLVDVLRGTNDYRYNWLGWEAVDMAATVDLGKAREVDCLAAHFLQVVGSWVWLPVEVRWSTSLDGEHWEPAGVLRPSNPATRDDPFTERFENRFTARPARYVRIEAVNMKHCPAWHHGAGGDAWIFCDEIMVFSGTSGEGKMN